MRMTLLAAAAALFAAGAAHATNVPDPAGDELASFAGTGATFFSDLDIRDFKVDLNAAHTAFDFSATFEGPFDSTHTGIYVIGVDTGAGAFHPFADIGEGNVIFDQAIVVRNTGVASLGATSLTPSLHMSGNTFTLSVLTSLLPSTGFASPVDYRFNLWSRNGLGANNQNADFAPENATFTAVPEPATWALTIFGFALAGAAVRGRRAAATA